MEIADTDRFRDFARLHGNRACCDTSVSSNAPPSNLIPISMSLSWVRLPQNADVAATTPIGTPAGRVSERILICCPASLSHGDDTGHSRRVIRGRALNISASGALVEALRPIAVGSEVRIQANELLTGIAFVRHSTRRLWRFRIGLEFAKPIQNRY